MNYNFIIMGETPSKKNSKIFTRGRHIPIPSAAHQRWHTDALLQLNAQICRAMKKDQTEVWVERAAEIKIVFYHGDLQRRDCDNQTSAILDLLQDAKVLQDDNWQIVRRLFVENEYDKGNARAQVSIIDYKSEAKEAI